MKLTNVQGIGGLKLRSCFLEGIFCFNIFVCTKRSQYRVISGFLKLILKSLLKAPNIIQFNFINEYEDMFLNLVCDCQSDGLSKTSSYVQEWFCMSRGISRMPCCQGIHLPSVPTCAKATNLLTSILTEQLFCAVGCAPQQKVLCLATQPGIQYPGLALCTLGYFWTFRMCFAQICGTSPYSLAGETAVCLWNVVEIISSQR